MNHISDLVNCKEYKQITANVCKNHSLKNDLHSEAILLIIEKNYDLSINTDLKKFFATVVWLTWRSNKFRMKYRSEFEEHKSSDDYEEPIEKQIDYGEILQMINDNYTNEFEFYEKTLLRLYIELGDSRSISKKTNIPYRTVANDIKQIKDKLKRLHYDKNSD